MGAVCTGIAKELLKNPAAERRKAQQEREKGPDFVENAWYYDEGYNEIFKTISYDKQKKKRKL